MAQQCCPGGNRPETPRKTFLGTLRGVSGGSPISTGTSLLSHTVHMSSSNNMQSNINGVKSFFSIPFLFQCSYNFTKMRKLRFKFKFKANQIDLIKITCIGSKKLNIAHNFLKIYGAIGNSMLCYEILRDLCNCSFLTMVKSSFSSSSDKFGQSDWTLRTTFFIILSSRPWTTLRRCSSRIFSMSNRLMWE